jgi:hypothetical protein
LILNEITYFPHRARQTPRTKKSVPTLHPPKGRVPQRLCAQRQKGGRFFRKAGE